VDGYTIPEAAELAGVDRRELREAVERGLVPARRLGGRWHLRVAGADDLRVALASRGDPVKRLAAAPPAGDRPALPEDELRALSYELEELRARMTRLEARVESPDRPPDGDGAMRSALTPLFRNT